MVKQAGCAEWSDEQELAIRAQLDRLLSSAPLRNAPRRQRLLRHLVEATLAGAEDRLKGFTLGMEVFDRGADFDPNVDAIVRVEVARLRGKLLEYYVEDGVRDPVLIELPKGAYVVRITFRAAPAGSAAQSDSVNEPAREQLSIAVIPFTNLSADPEQEYFADGITEDLITDLSKLSGLFVISRHSAFVYKGANRRIEEIGAQLGVRYVLEGSVRRAGDTLRITAQLIDVRSGAHVWAQRYDRPMRDVFAVQDDVTHRIVHALAVSLSSQEQARIGHEGTASLEAYDSLLRGLERFWAYTPEANAEAQTFFRRAVELDPEYAAAHAWLSRSMLFDYIMRWGGAASESLELACHYARTAVSLDGLLPYALSALCWAELWARNGEASLRAGRRAVALDPNSADGRLFLSIALWASGRGEEALSQIDMGMRLNPHPSSMFFWAHGAALLTLQRYEEAIADFETGIRLRAAFLPNLIFATWSCVEFGRMGDARRYRDAVVALTGCSQVPLRVIWLDVAWERRFQDAMLRIGMTLEA